MTRGLFASANRKGSPRSCDGSTVTRERQMRKALGIALAFVVLTGVWATLAYTQSDLLPKSLRMSDRDGVASEDKVLRAKTPRASNGGSGGLIAVEAKSARQARVSTDIRAVGSLQSDEAVQIASEIAGRIAEIPFKEGQPVRAGDVIARLDEALVKADIADAEARLRLAKQNNDRAKALVRTGAVTERSRDEAISNFEIAQAAVELAKTRLDKHTLRAPFDGVAGVRNVSIGAYVAVGTPIVNIEKLDTLKVDFKVPEIYLTDIKVGQTVDVTLDAVPGQTFAGEIYAINPLVDVNGRSLHVRARLANSQQLLRPGLFARITIKGLAEREVTLVPESAIVPRGGDAFVYRVDNGQAIEARVKLGARKDAEVEVLEGLEPTAIVVTAGQQKLKNGSGVEIVSAGDVLPPGARAPENKPGAADRSG